MGSVTFPTNVAGFSESPGQKIAETLFCANHHRTTVEKKESRSPKL